MPRGSDISTSISATPALSVGDAPFRHRERPALLAAVWIACVAFVCGLTIADPDLWGHTLYGLRANNQGTFAESQDPFSYTAAGANWVNHEWLSESQFGWLWQHFGNAGLVFWRNAWCVVVFTVALAALRRSSASLPAAVLLLVLNAETLSDFMVFVRPQMATFGLFAIYLYLLNQFWAERRWQLLVPLPVLMVVWVNHHGGFLAGLGVSGVTVAALLLERIRHRSNRQPVLAASLILGLTILATFVNPYGSELHQMLWSHLWTPQFVREWQPLWSVSQSPVYYVPFLLTGIALCGSRRWTAMELLILAVVAWEAVSHVRHVALFCVATLVLLPGHLTETLTRLFPTIIQQWSGVRRLPLRIAAVAAVIVFLSVIHIRGSLGLWQRGITPLTIAAETRSDVPGIPMGAISFIDSQNLTGNLLTDYGWGQYVIWHLHPRIRVGFDGRYRTVYPADVEQKFLDFQALTSNSTTVTPMLDEFETDIVLLPANRGPQAYMAQRSDWHLVYRDEQASVYVRDTAPHQQLIAQYSLQPARDEELAVWTEFPAGPVSQASHLSPLAGESIVERDLTPMPIQTQQLSPDPSDS